jgi:hypothetical protein
MIPDSVLETIMLAGQSDNSRSSSFRKMGWLMLFTVLLWGVMSGPAYWVRGVSALEGLSYAALLCLIPGWVVVYVTSRYPDGGSQAGMVLLGTGLRMAFVLIGMVMLSSRRPDLGLYEFQVWLILFYLAFLVIETAMVVKNLESKEN